MERGKDACREFVPVPVPVPVPAPVPVLVPVPGLEPVPGLWSGLGLREEGLCCVCKPEVSTLPFPSVVNTARVPASTALAAAEGVQRDNSSVSLDLPSIAGATPHSLNSRQIDSSVTILAFEDPPPLAGPPLALVPPPPVGVEEEEEEEEEEEAKALPLTAAECLVSWA